jgi:hypothetical protein
MKEAELAELAALAGVSEHYVKGEKKFLIRELQRALGHEPCYMTDVRYSCSKGCAWSESCRKLVAEWRR